MFGENFDDTSAGSRTQPKSGCSFGGFGRNLLKCGALTLRLSSRIHPLCILHFAPSNATSRAERSPDVVADLALQRRLTEELRKAEDGFLEAMK
jgi:hypothetical protein